MRSVATIQDPCVRRTDPFANFGSWRASRTTLGRVDSVDSRSAIDIDQVGRYRMPAPQAQGSAGTARCDTLVVLTLVKHEWLDDLR